MPNIGGRYEIRNGKRVRVEGPGLTPAPTPQPQAAAKPEPKADPKPATPAAKQPEDVKEADDGR